ncbi:MAG: fibronectin type III, partial [Flavobacteriaceae bacterium]|nr:fibronectin type III [Flavobacteriaceae bacterium]
MTLEKEIESEAVVLSADGPGDTYELITSVLAPGSNPVEVPDCNLPAFGRHIDEIFDNDLNTNVFRFFIHVTPDNDRCINFDRQRNEIKTYDQSPDNLLGIENETVQYKWKFKLEDGFQSSPNFTHIHQLKSVGGDFESMPMYTLTTRKGSPDRLELRYAETDSQITLTQTDLAPLIGTWLEVTET